MATREKVTLLILPDHGNAIEVDADDDTVYFSEHGILGGWDFDMTTDDWERVKKYVDEKINLARK